MSKTKTCSIEGCNNVAYNGRSICHEHYLERRRKSYKDKKDRGEKYRTMYRHVCVVCGKEYFTTRKTSRCICNDCWSNYDLKTFQSTNNYKYSGKDLYKKGIWEHRILAEKKLNRTLDKDEVVHHIDLNSKNNSLENLLVIDRKHHIKLHDFLKKKFLIDKDISLYESTMSFLNTNNINYILL